MVKKIYKTLTEDQMKRGVIFSSTLSSGRTERSGDVVHEVKEDTPNAAQVVKNLTDDSFFNKYRPFNIIRRGKRKLREVV